MTISAIPLASAYPSPELPAGQLAMMIVVPAALLFVWLIMVYLAARSGNDGRRPPRQLHAPGETSAIAAPDAADEDAAGIEPQLRQSARL